MGELDLNLSTRPFPAYKLKTLLLTVALFVLIGISVWQASGFMYYSSLSAQIRGNAQTEEVNARALARRLSEMESKLNQPEAMAKLNEIGFLNDIITRKSFSWTRMFATLEQLTPDSVHLVTLRPEFTDSGILLHLDVRGRTMSDITQFIEALQASPVFDTVRVHSEMKAETATVQNASDLEVALSVPYHPEREGQ